MKLSALFIRFSLLLEHSRVVTRLARDVPIYGEKSLTWILRREVPG